jgi:peptidoglycan/xylan/chitin deacetylase (PgdA/CDA1 family)
MVTARLRVDRLATLYFVYPLRSSVARRRGLQIPILMYHSISEISNNGVHPYFVTETTPKTFECHMKYLYDNAYRAISPDQVVVLLNSGRRDHTKYVVITFDDGYRDFYTHAFPILHKYEFTASVYLPTAYINHRARKFLTKDCLTWSEIRELHKAGISFGSHTITHQKLKFLSHSDCEHEVRYSKERIETELGTAIHSFAYPYAFPEEDRNFTRRLQGCLEGCGYRSGVSTVIGSIHSPEDRFFLKRLPANSCDDLKLFRAKLEGSYDWMHGAQYLWKSIRR